jgi:hypothetical protein
MATPPDFTAGQILTAAQMNSVSLWLVKTETIGNAVSSVVVADAFNNDFDNYLITVNGGAASTNGIMRIAFGATTTNYYYQLLFGTWANTPFAEGATNANNIQGVGSTITTGLQMFCHVFNPFLATRTTVSASRYTTSDVGSVFGLLDNSTSYNSFTLSPSAGTLTGGIVRVYGYRK